MKKYKITVEDLKTKEKIVVDCEMYIMSIGECKKGDIINGGGMTSDGTYSDLCRLYTSLGARLHKNFTEVIEKKEQSKWL